MSRTSRVFLFVALCVLPSVACGQLGTTANGDDAEPAPAEPGSSTTKPSKSDADELPQRYERTPDAIPGTELGPATSISPMEQAFDAQAAFSELETRINQLEERLKQQVARLNELEQSSMHLADNRGESLTVNKPPTPVDANDSKDSPAMDRDARFAELRGELEQLQADYGELFVAAADQTTAINDQSQILAMHGDEIKAHGKKLETATQQLNDLETGQRALAVQLRDAAVGDGSGGPSILGNMQADPQLRRQLYGNMRYRLRIHNTAGVELPISVNGVSWTVRADEWTFVPIPYGPVTVHRPGFESVEISEDQIGWEADSRGFFVNYDYESNRVTKSSKD